MIKLISKLTATIAVVSIALLGSANAKTLKIETHFTASSPNGEVAAQFAKNVEIFSGGSLKVEMFYSASVTGKSAEVFNSARTGIIDCDFNLGLSPNIVGRQFTMGIMAYRQNKVPLFTKEATIIQKKKRPWNKDDAKFWSKYLVSKKILTMFGVEPISHFWVNNNRFTCKSITYAFKFKNRYKIYSPYEDKNKWLSNTNKTDVQGYNQLPNKGERLIITSSLKDVMCLYAAGYNAIAMQSEMQIPSEKLISELTTRFNTIEILYDNDFFFSKKN